MILFFTIILAVFLIWNWLIIQKRSPNHAGQVVYRSITWAIGAALFSGGDHERLITYFIAFHLAFMFPFNTGLNFMRGKAWNYIGETAWLDRQGRKWPGAFIPGQILLFIIGMGLLIFE